MPKGRNQKLKMLFLSKILTEKTDENHGLTTPEIIGFLEDFQINEDRKTLYQDLEELRHFGIDIKSEQNGRNVIYKLVSREFELPELKLLVDAVQSSKFITEKKSRALIRKLEALVSQYDAKQLHRQVAIAGRVKTMNESVYLLTDQIHTAIGENKQIRFHYWSWTPEGKQVLRRNGSWYQVSPWRMRWDDENYYLMAYDAESDFIRHFRVDKMKNIQILDTPRLGKERMDETDPILYTKRLFGMFGGDAVQVTLVGENDIAGVIIDRFGKDVHMYPLDDSHFEVRVEVAISDQFFGWVFSLGGKLRIAEPDAVIQQMGILLQKISAQYVL